MKFLKKHIWWILCVLGIIALGFTNYYVILFGRLMMISGLTIIGVSIFEWIETWNIWQKKTRFRIHYVNDKFIPQVKNQWFKIWWDNYYNFESKILFQLNVIYHFPIPIKRIKRKMYKKGLIIGKFYPYQKGHEYLITKASEQCEKLIVLLCSLATESIPGDLRQKWMYESLTKQGIENVEIIHVFDENPAEPKDDYDDRFWDIWISTIKRYTDDIDVIFTSEEYGKEFTKRLNDSNRFKFKIDHISVDQARRRFPVSGTKMRNDPMKYWDFIPEPAKPHFLKRIAIVGPESTGKSTMSEALAKEFSTIFVPEYGREFTDKEKISLYGIEQIAFQQIRMEDSYAERANKLLFCDTELITTQIWSEIYFKTYPQWIWEMNNVRKYDLFLLMDIDIPWEDDGTREFPNMRAWHFKRIRDELYKRNLNYKIISGDRQDRINNAIKIIYSEFFDY